MYGISNINTKKESLKKEIDEEIKKAETEILDFKNKSPEKINKIAIEIAKKITRKVINRCFLSGCNKFILCLFVF